MPPKISMAILGGSGLYNISGLTETTEYHLETPFGKPSAPIVVGMLEGKRVAFLARHGVGHQIMPTEVPFRANIYALKSLGVDRIISISACGSLREDYAPGDIVIPDQIFDHTKYRSNTFFGEGLVAHIGVSDPFCPELSKSIETAVVESGATVHQGGTFIIIEGPRFSTKAESNYFRSWGASIIGMTTAPEAFLAREAEICYAVMAHVTDYDVWHTTEAPVSVEMVIKTLNHNTQAAQTALKNLVKSLSEEHACSCSSALTGAIITHPSAIPIATRDKLGLLIGKYIPAP
jgi:5'-methylthioadenosine phosphorylase